MAGDSQVGLSPLPTAGSHLQQHHGAPLMQQTPFLITFIAFIAFIFFVQWIIMTGQISLSNYQSVTDELRVVSFLSMKTCRIGKRAHLH